MEQKILRYTNMQLIKKHFRENRGKPDYELIVSTGLYVVNKVMKLFLKTKI